MGGGTVKTVEQIAAGLSEAQRRFLLASSKHPKKWMTIRRHAKLADPVRVHRLQIPLRLIDHGPDWGKGYALTPLGLAVRAILKEQDDAR